MSFTDLPLIYDLVQPAKTCNRSRPTTPCTCSHIAKKNIKPPVPDRRLEHWKRWMRRRKEMHVKLGNLLKREPGTLIMNNSEELRSVKEEKCVMEYATIPEPDSQRGCPGFWKMPAFFKDACGIPTYFSVLTKEDKCEIPEIEYVGNSAPIMKEKDVLPRTRNTHELWKRSSYVKHKSAELSYEISRVASHKPMVQDLYITNKLQENQPPKPMGVTFGKQPDFLEPTGSLTADGGHDEDNETPSILTLDINEFHLGRDRDILRTRKIFLFFDYDIATTKIATQYLYLRNTGTVTIRFYWKPSQRVDLFKDIIPDKSDDLFFYFNKNEGLIIPGQSLEFPVWFETGTAGVYTEQWEFYTKPSILSKDARLVVVLHASAVFGDLDKKASTIKDKLNDNIRDRLIKESLSEVLSNVPYDKYKPTVYSYNKKEVFETVNSGFDPVHRQAKYYYNKDVVRELQKFYKKVKRASDPKCWNYRIEELKLLTRAKQRNNELIQNLSEREKGEKIYENRPKFPKLPCTETAFPNFEKPKPPISEDKKIKKPNIPFGKPLTQQLEEILISLECPATETNLEKTKYNQAYLILSSYFTKIEDEFDDLKNRLGIVKETKYPKFPIVYQAPLYYKPIRLVNERLFDVLQGNPLMPKVGSKSDQPAAEILKDIPMEDPKKRYRTYYNLPLTSEQNLVKPGKGKDTGQDKGKDKQAPLKKDDKGAKAGKPVKTEEDEDDGYVVNEKFDPYAEVNLPPIEEPMCAEEVFEVESNLDTLPPAVLRQYKYNLHIIMYNYLDKAIGNIVDMVEQQPRDNLPYAVIKEFELPKHNRRLIDLKGLIAEENLQQVKAKLLLYQYRKQSKKDWKSMEIQRQLRGVRSDSSLWSVLRPYDTKQKLPESKPISYPVDHYDSSEKKLPSASNEETSTEPDLKRDISTSTLEGGVLDVTWEDFKDKALQKDYGEGEEPDDLEAYMEKLATKTSMQDLADFKFHKTTQKKSDDHVSDEEYFYDSEIDDLTLSAISISMEYDSEQSENEYESCSCEGFGVCNLPVEEQCSCEGFGECNHNPLEQVLFEDDCDKEVRV